MLYFWAGVEEALRLHGPQPAPWLVRPNPLLLGGAISSPLIRRDISLSSLVAGLDYARSRALEGVAKAASDKRRRVFLVGGPVRDALLGRPVVDLDFSVEGDAQAFARFLAERIGGDVQAHPRFGTATVQAGWQADCRLDFVTARRERYLGPGQLPIVSPAGIKDDLRRRDFTINALAIPVTEEQGSIVDPVGGLQDLDSGFIRAIQPHSFVDDPTRLFRAARYEQRLGFHIEAETLALMGEAVSSGCVDTVSGDRLRHELERIFTEWHPGRVLLRAAALGLLASLHPALSDDRGLRALDESTDGAGEPDELMAALFLPLQITDAEAIIQRLRLFAHQATLARDTIELVRIAPQICAASERPSEVDRLLSSLDTVAISLQAKVATHPTLREAFRRYLGDWRFRRLVITGDDLLEMGAVQGPMVGEILARLQRARIDGEISAADEERTLAKSLVAQRLEGVNQEY